MAESRTDVPKERVLLVDDDANVLRAYERRLRRKFNVETALCSEEGVTAANFFGPFAVIVSDMAMPRESGADFLVRMLDLSPDSVRIMLTGNADQATAVQAVNRARVFRFLNKPCAADALEEAIQAGIDEYRARVAERDLMAQTVHGVVSMLTRVLSLVSPIAFGRATRLRTLAGEVAVAAEIDDPWRLEIAAALSQLGAVTIPEGTLKKLAADEKLEGREAAQVDQQYVVAAGLIGEAPRLEEISRIVALQSDKPDESDPATVVRDAELLAATVEFDHLVDERGLERAEALVRVEEDPRFTESAALAALRKVVAKHDSRRLVEVSLAELADGMTLVDDVTTTTGMVLVSKGHEVTASLHDRLRNYAHSHEIALPIRAMAIAEVADAIEATRSTT